jgi:hypothetical protein
LAAARRSLKATCPSRRRARSAARRATVGRRVGEEDAGLFEELARGGGLGVGVGGVDLAAGEDEGVRHERRLLVPLDQEDLEPALALAHEDHRGCRNDGHRGFAHDITASTPACRIS